MAIQRYKVALNAARFPLVSTKGSRAVFIPGLDSAQRNPRTFMGSEMSADYNVAQLVYGENIVPLAEGYGSVGYTQSIGASVNNDFTSLFPLRDSDENTVLYSPSKGKNYIYDAVAGAWTADTHEAIFSMSISPSSASTRETAKVSYAYVDGYTFVCYSRLKSTIGIDMSIMFWNPATNSLNSAAALVTNLPFDVGAIDGVAASSGFLLVWSGIEIAWAPFNGTAFDFTNYASGDYTGAGSQIPEDIKGNIRAILGVSGGFLAFTNKNCVAGHYHAQNIVAPWLFREVSGAGGIDSYEQATVEGSLGVVYAYTTAGFQRVTLNSTEALQPQVTDFITGRQYETFNIATGRLTTVSSGQDLAVKVSNIGNRYVTISYGLTEGAYEFILILDLQLERWGKLKFNHVDCFYYTYTPGASAITYAMAMSVTYADLASTPYAALLASPTSELAAAPHALGLLSSTGEITIANWDTTSRNLTDAGVAVIGRVQLSRSRNIQLNRVEIEGLAAGDVLVQASSNGRTIDTARQLVEIERDGDFAVLGTMIDCKNFNLVVSGGFNLSTIIVEATTTGQF